MAFQVKSGGSSESEICKECYKLPAEIFTPGSSTVHRLYEGGEAVARIHKTIQTGCRFCTLLYDALKAGERSSELTINKDGILLKAEWSPLQRAAQKSIRFDDSADTHNRHLLRNHYIGYEDESRDLFGPLLSLTWGKENISRLRFSVEQYSPRKKGSDTFRVGWDSYYKSRTFQTSGTNIFRQWLNSQDNKVSPLASKADSPEAFQLMNTWLDECLEKHDKCKTDGMHVDLSSFVLPTRLIDCRPENLCLVDTINLPRNSEGYGPPYTTLSHCWGKDTELVTKTTKTNLAAAHKAIAFNELSQTFQDAIQVTRKINVQYIWIDSLCIIQDDEEDKDRELSTMDLIYSMAICLIVASGSGDGRGGCFIPRAPNPDIRVHPYTLNLHQRQSNALVTIQPYLADWGQAITSGPLYHRGWCFQERQLSKRIIYFTESRILWECRVAVASEDHPKMAWISFNDYPSVERPFRMSWIRVTDVVLLAGSPKRTDPWFKEWYKVVEAYSSKNLSVPKDRLPALAGLAAFFEMKLKMPNSPSSSDYVAGLWFIDLAKGLSWFPDFSYRNPSVMGTSWPTPLKEASFFPTTTPDKGWLPSWSWISIDAPVRYYYKDSSTDPPSTSGIMVDPRSQNAGLPLSYFPLKTNWFNIGLCSQANFKFGAVACGLVELNSFALEISISEKDLIPNPSGAVNTPKCYTMFKDRISPFKLFTRPDRFANGVVYFDVDPYVLPETEVYCLRLETGHSFIDKAGTLVDFGLALIKVKTPLAAEFATFPAVRRVGMFEIDVWNKRWPKEARRESFVLT